MLGGVSRRQEDSRSSLPAWNSARPSATTLLVERVSLVGTGADHTHSTAPRFGSRNFSRGQQLRLCPVGGHGLTPHLVRSHRRPSA